MSRLRVTEPDALHKGRVAYIMKGFPRLSEPFISNEITLLESMGVRLRILAVKGLSESRVRGVVDRLEAEVTYLPEEPAVEGAPFRTWLRTHWPRFWGSHRCLLQRRPRAYLRTLALALRFSLRYRRSRWPRFKKVFFKDFLRAGYMAWRIVEAGDVRHLHGHFCHGSTTMALFVSRLTGLPYSFTAHAKDIYLPKLNPGDLLPRKIRAARFVVTCTDYNRQALQARCPESRNVRTIYHGLDPRLFTPAEPRCEPHPAVILSVGRHVGKKGFDVLIRACGLLRDAGYDAVCRIVGEADAQTPVLVRLIASLQLDAVVRLHGPVPQTELCRLYQQSTVFALPCQVLNNGDRDGIPNVLVEAMATGLPVVSTPVSGIPELITPHVDGVLVPSRDPQALADALGTLLQEPARRQLLGKNARETVCQRFDSRKTTAVLRDLFLVDCHDAGARRV